MEIRIDPHTLERAEERGANAEEIKDVIMNGFPISAKRGRQGAVRVFMISINPAMTKCMNRSELK